MGFHLFSTGEHETKMKMPANSLVINTETATNTSVHLCHFFVEILYSVRQMDVLARAMPKNTKAPPVKMILAAAMARVGGWMVQM